MIFSGQLIFPDRSSVLQSAIDHLPQPMMILLELKLHLVGTTCPQQPKPHWRRTRSAREAFLDSRTGVSDLENGIYEIQKFWLSIFAHNPSSLAPSGNCSFLLAIDSLIIRNKNPIKAKKRMEVCFIMLKRFKDQILWKFIK